MRRARAIGVACAFAVATVGLVREVQASSPAFDLEYSVPAGCPSEQGFRSDVGARIADRGGAPADRRRFRVRIVEEGGAFRGALETLEPSSVREVAGASCEEVARALVVFLALAVSPAEPEEPVSGSSPVARENEAAGRGPLPPSTSSRAHARGASLSSRFGLELRGLVATGLSPGLSPGGAVAARVVLASRPSLGWVMHVGGIFTYREESVLRGHFDFLWAAAAIDAGPAFEVGRFRFSGGPVIHAGALTVGARDLPSAGNYSGFWGDVGVFARVDRVLTSSIAVSLMVELAAPLQRRSFGIQGVQTPVHEIPRVFGIASLGFTLGD
jgi:hypothetical protein